MATGGGPPTTGSRSLYKLSLAHDLPSLWESPSTQDKDRKRIFRLLIKDITVERMEAKKIVLHLRWQGGACEDIPVLRPPRYSDQIRYSNDVVGRVKRLAQELRDTKIAAKLYEAGLLSPKGNRFTPSRARAKVARRTDRGPDCRKVCREPQRSVALD